MSVNLPTQEAEIRRMVVRSQSWEIVHKIYLEKKKIKTIQNRDGRVVQVIECLPNKCEASNRHPLLTPTQKMAASL
jgi:hypothetical protein